MSGRTLALGLISLTASFVSTLNVAKADVTPVQSASIPDNTQTNWSSSTSSLAGINPLTFKQFDTSLGTLQSVNVTMSYSISQSVSLTYSTAATLTVTSGFTPSAGAPLQGTTVDLTLPTGSSSTTLLEGQAPVLTYMKSFDPGSTPQTFSTNLPPTSPYYLAPQGQTGNTFTGTKTTTITDPSMLALFQGTGTIGLPASSRAGSSVTQDNGNYGSTILTYAGVTVTISYNYTPSTVVPEPSSIVLMGLGGGVTLLSYRIRRRRSA